MGLCEFYLNALQNLLFEERNSWGNSSDNLNEYNSHMSNGQARAVAPIGVRGEVDGPLRTEANWLDC